MSGENNPFRFLPTLQHMASVEIIGTLLRNSKYKKVIKDESWDIFFYVTKDPGESKLNNMIEELEVTIDQLPAPQVLAIDFKSFLPSIVQSAIDWLVWVVRNTPKPLEKQYWMETIAGLMANLQWDNIGCIDGRKTLESYVSTKKTIDFVIWNQLCLHCMKDDIIRFSKTIDWNKCTGYFDSVFPIYWYHKIYGTLPKRAMYEPKLYDHLHDVVHEATLDEKRILRAMFAYSVPLIPVWGTNSSAIMYFRNYSENDGEFYELIPDSDFWIVTDQVLLYLLKSVKEETSLNTIFKESNSEMINALVKPPWILFIDDWISVFETVEAICLSNFFKFIGNSRTKIKSDRKKTLDEPLEKVWRIYYRRFSSDREKMKSAFYHIFTRQDVMLAKLMFKDLEDHQRILLIKEVKDYLTEEGWRTLDKNFFAGFLKMLKNDEERNLFAEIRNL